MTVPPRMPDWRPRLTAYLIEIAPASFRFGSQDCALFAAGAIRAMTGHDPAGAFRGAYTTFEGGVERLKAAGFASHIDVVDTLFDRIAPAFAQVGDLVLIDAPDGPALGVMNGETIACLNPRGLAHWPRDAAAAAWTVP